MFRRNKTPEKKREPLTSIVAGDMNVLGNIVSDGTLDVDGTIDGNVRCKTLTVRPQGVVGGEVTADSVMVYGRIKGVIRARHVQLCAGCHIEGTVMHESLTIEDGAFIDGKCKRTDKRSERAEEAAPPAFQDFLAGEQEQPAPAIQPLKNIRLIRS